MTPDDLVRSLTYRRDELRLLSDALGVQINWALGKNVRLDHPDVAWLLDARGYVDGAIRNLRRGLSPSGDRGMRIAAGDGLR
jgi:hypothetical protein